MSSAPFRVLGVALVVDQRGAEARMVLRYPGFPSEPTPNDEGKYGDDRDNVFFQLQSRSMAKLFRPKQALCGQPMTLSVGGTVFCCSAHLMNQPQESTVDKGDNTPRSPTNASSSSAGSSSMHQGDRDELVLFSIVVALVPRAKSGSLPISGWFEGDKRSIQGDSHDDLNREAAFSLENKASASFLAVRKVHVSLGRLCRALEREERRCRYISLQSDLFLSIQQKMQIEAEQRLKGPLSQHQQPPPPPQAQSQASAVPPQSQVQAGTSSATASPVSISTKGQIASKHSHRRVGSLMSAVSSISEIQNVRPPMSSVASSSAPKKKSEDDFFSGALDEQLVLEAMTTAPPPVFKESGLPHQGNLARELMEVFHALSRNDDLPPTSWDVLTAQSCTVHVNQHVAIALESVAVTSLPCIVWPFQTILLTKVTPLQLRESMANTSTAPRRLHQFLMVLSPRKALWELDTNLSLSVIMELAEYLVAQGVARPFPVMSDSTRLACIDLPKIDKLSLSFRQSFDVDVQLFVLVSFLTMPGRDSGGAVTLGHCLSSLKSGSSGHSGNAVARLIRKRLLASPLVKEHPSLSNLQSAPAPRMISSEAHSDIMSRNDDGVDFSDAVEDVILRMIVWLLTRGVLTQLQEFLVSGPAADATAAVDSEAKETSTGTTPLLSSSPDEIIYQQLSHAGCLMGKTSLPMCAWKLSIDISLLREWAERHQRIRIITRSPDPSDDQDVDEFKMAEMKDI